jgi:hypothetical protein
MFFDLGGCVPLPQAACVFFLTEAAMKTGQKTGRMKPFCGNRETILKQTGRRSLANRGRTVVREAHMNHSIHSADRSTHLKIVVVALVAGIAVAAFGISARTASDYSQTAQVVKAGKPVVVTSSNTSTVR